MMCIINILPLIGLNDMNDVHDMFAQLGKLIDRCNEYDTPTIDAPRLKYGKDLLTLNLQTGRTNENNRVEISYHLGR